MGSSEITQTIIAQKEARLAHYQSVKEYEAANGIPDTRVAVLCPEFKDRQDHFVCVRERVIRDGNYYTAASEIWGLPSGCVQLGESIDEAALRIFRDEAGCEANFEKICHIAQRTNPDNHYLIVVAVVYRFGELQKINSPEILDCGFKTMNELIEYNSKGQLRNPHLTLEACKGYKSGRCSYTLMD